MLYLLIAILVVMNLAAFALMGIDKAKAKAGAWRIPEKTLFLVTALFGGLGGTLGMSFFRHKTKHWYCWVVNVIGLVLHILIAVWLYLYF